MKKLLFITMLLFTSSIIAQQLDSLCLTAPSSTHLLDLEAIKGLDHSNDIFYVKLYIHVLRKETEPKLGQTKEDVNRQLQYLYDDFDPLGIHFVWFGDINYIDNDEYYGHVADNISAIFNTNSHSDGIDIYFFDVEQGNQNGGFGLANDIGGSALMVGGAHRGRKEGGQHIPLSWYKIVSHEMGHVLFFWHTHHGTFDEGTGNECPELVNGSNGTTCGDYIADTPADPNIMFANYNSCEIIEDPNNYIPDFDANGDPYQPDTSNLMSYTYPTCMEGFTYGQKKRMKNAIWYLPVLHNTLLENYTYIRPDDNCFVCGFQTFKVYSSVDLNHLYPISSENVTSEIIEQTNDYITIKVTNLLGNDKGERGHVYIVNSGKGMIVAAQQIWVGKPQTVPDDTLNGPTEVSSGGLATHKIDDGNLRLDGIETYNWDFPEPNESWVFFGGPPPNDPIIWEYSYISKYVPKVTSSVGNQTGYVTVRGENPCGLGSNGDIPNELCVENIDDPEGDICDDGIPPIIYYPNPADSLLSIDLSLQDYDIFTVTVYNDSQVAVYTDQSENVVKTIDTFNLANGTYYLHIYDSSNELILSRILIINH